MATEGNNLSGYDASKVPNGADFTIGIVVSEWNDQITGNLLKGAKQTLLDNGVLDANILTHFVPGTFELPLGAQFLLETGNVDAVITIGSVIKGETQHFDFVCQGATQGIQNVSLKYNAPVIFCVLTDNFLQQAIDRSGGKHGNKGVEAAVAALKMLALKASISPK